MILAVRLRSLGLALVSKHCQDEGDFSQSGVMREGEPGTAGWGLCRSNKEGGSRSPRPVVLRDYSHAGEIITNPLC
jgi:hypothetical protein